MNRVRARLVEWTPAALALFVATVATPRAGLFFHVHADGDHVHVHADGDGQHDHGAEPFHIHHDQHHDHVVAHDDEEPELEAPDHDETGHWHSQNRFQRALAPTPIGATGIQIIRRARPLPEYAAVDRPILCAHARGPPLAA